MNLSPAEEKLFRSLRDPRKIQDFINTLEMRTDSREPIVRSPRRVLELKKASCIEGALLAAAILAYHGKEPYILDLKVSPRNNNDEDHTVALFKKDGAWGAISKTTHAVLRYREPIYRTVRELAMSYFHEYFTYDGKKNLRSYSKPFDVSSVFGKDWVTSSDDLYELAYELDQSRHFEILTRSQEKFLRPADTIEIKASKITDKTARRK